MPHEEPPVCLVQETMEGKPSACSEHTFVNISDPFLVESTDSEHAGERASSSPYIKTDIYSSMVLEAVTTA
jgi:hypothetical protein